MSATTASANGRPQRKQLSDQLDRLDSIIDALAEGLPGAVADACREGAREAVRTAITEVLGNPELRALLAPRPTESAPAPVPVPVARPDPWTRLREVLARARTTVTRRVRAAWDAVTSPVRAATGLVTAVGKLTDEPLPVRRILLVGLGTGLAVGAVSLAVPQVAAAALSAASSGATAVAVQTGRWLRRAAVRFGLMG